MIRRAVCFFTGSFRPAPLPVRDFGQVHAVFGDILLVLHELVLHLLDEVGPAVAELRQVVHRGHDEIKAVEAIEHAHVEGRGDGALLDIAADVDVLVAALIGHLVY